MNSERSIIYFDIDKTLLDSNRLVTLITDGFVHQGISRESFEAIMKEYYGTLTDTTDFDPDSLIDVLVARLQMDQSAIESIFFNKQNFENALFPEVIAALTALSEMHILGIFSQGNYHWQMLKLQLSGLSPFITNSYSIIEGRKLIEESITQLKNNSAVVDDKLEVVQTLKAQRPDLQVFWVNRTNQVVMDSDFKAITVITALNELKNLTLEPQS